MKVLNCYWDDSNAIKASCKDKDNLTVSRIVDSFNILILNIDFLDVWNYLKLFTLNKSITYNLHLTDVVKFFIVSSIVTFQLSSIVTFAKCSMLTL